MIDPDQLKTMLLSEGPVSAIVALLNRPYDSSQQTKAEFTVEAVEAGFDMALAAIEAGAAGVHVRASVCPQCGCADVDLDATDIEAGKLVCWQCGHIYGMEYGNSIPVAEADYSDKPPKPRDPGMPTN